MIKLAYLLCLVITLYGCRIQHKSYQLSERKLKALRSLSSKQINDSVIVNPPYFTEPTSNSKNSNYVNINCLYATDRNIIIKSGRPTFGYDRSEIHYGNCNVSIPKTHDIGELETKSLLKLELNEDPNKHISILNISNFKKENFFNEVNLRIANSSQKSAFVFIHGYNVNFNTAAKRTAQLYYDFSLKGIPVFYSWPSQDNPIKYTIDENNSEWSAANFKIFLNDFIIDSKVDNIYLIAHSMGNRLLINALVNLAKEMKFDNKRIKEIILVAPDIDISIFKRDYAPYLTDKGIPITLYLSSSDNALIASKIVHGNIRVGSFSKSPLIMKGIETIDATNANTDILGHSYFGNSRSIADDVFYLINNHLRADQR